MLDGMPEACRDTSWLYAVKRASCTRITANIATASTASTENAAAGSDKRGSGKAEYKKPANHRSGPPIWPARRANRLFGSSLADSGLQLYDVSVF